MNTLLSLSRPRTGGALLRPIHPLAQPAGEELGDQDQGDDRQDNRADAVVFELLNVALQVPTHAPAADEADHRSGAAGHVPGVDGNARSEERRGGQAGGRTYRSRWSTDP